MKALDDPTSELAQQLLTSEELENERREPWWESPEVRDLETDVDLDARQRYGKRPHAIRVPSGMVKPLPHGPPLLYNICGLW
jgi:hypothetical protein